jgi:hypothetical protein
MQLRFVAESMFSSRLSRVVRLRNLKALLINNVDVHETGLAVFTTVDNGCDGDPHKRA